MYLTQALRRAVIGIADEECGERVQVAVVPRLEAITTPAIFIAHCRALIVHYKCASSLAFLEALPLSASGKSVSPSGKICSEASLCQSVLTATVNKGAIAPT